MGIASLIAVLTPPLLSLFQVWTQASPGASDDEAKAELQRLIQSDADATAAHDALQAEIAKAKAALAAETPSPAIAG